MAGLMSGVGKLDYQICRYSSYSTTYLPENILEDCPTNQASRWSSSSIKPPQFLTLKLKRPAVVKAIKFGKYEKSHVCNLKKFQIFGGLDEDHMQLLLEGGLNNDSIPETFMLRHTTGNGERFPILYLKIMPLLSYGPRFIFSIWYVELYGQDDPMYLGASLRTYNMLREIEIVKLCLKHFRQQGYDDAFKALQEQTNVRLEYPIITDLHRYLVNEGNFNKAEQFIEECINQGFMDDYLIKQDYKHSWKLQETKSVERPGTRGGHQLVIDTEYRLIYLYGGWDGFADLSDLWCFNIDTSKWSLLHECSELYGGPTPRSCHKMVFDPITRCIFMLGRYLDNSIRTTEYIKSDFYLYDTKKGTWLQICNDTSQVGGPHLVYDHQMCIDVSNRTIYVFGGKILTPRSVNQISYSAPEYSGLFSYHITTNTWQQLLVDCNHPSASKMRIASIKSRVTHCMVFHERKRKLYIYGGQRGKEDIDDFISYDVDTNCLNVLNIDKSNNSDCINNNNNNNNASNQIMQYRNEPPAGFTQRATLDCDRDEIYIFSSLSKQKDKRDSQQLDSSSNSFWVFSLKTNKWTQIYSSKHTTEDCYSLKEKTTTTTPTTTTATTLHLEPCPRYAHQLVYDDVKKVHYLFGGNPGKLTLPQLRLDDFWILLLEKPTRHEILRHCRYLVRKLRYEEMIRINPIEAIKYLQTQISEVIDHSDSVQVKKFHKLTFLLFKPEENCSSGNIFSLAFGNNFIKSSDSVRTTITDDDERKMHDEVNEINDTNTCEDFFIRENDETASIVTTTNDINSKINRTTTTTTTQTLAIIDKQMPLFDNFTYNLYKNCGGKKDRNEYYFDIKTRRTYLFNKIVQLMPINMVQPKGNLSDFVLI